MSLHAITRFITIVLAVTCFNLTSAQESFLSQENLQRLQQLIDSQNRSEGQRARNQYRHPLQTLDFFDVRPELTVVEIWPGGPGGWYRSILQPYIEGSGNYIPIMADVGFPNSPTASGADRVLVFRAHGFMIDEKPTQKYYDAIYQMLKPGGIFGIVDHRGDEAIPQDPDGDNGYVNQSHVIELAESAGFELIAEAEINANLKDNKDHQYGVYSLPPTLRQSRMNRLLNRAPNPEMLEIGESDRMTLKFIRR